MSVKVLTIAHLTDDAQEREEFFCPLLNDKGLAYTLRIQVISGRLHLAGFTVGRVKVWEAVAEIKEVT